MSITTTSLYEQALSWLDLPSRGLPDVQPLERRRTRMLSLNAYVSVMMCLPLAAYFLVTGELALMLVLLAADALFLVNLWGLRRHRNHVLAGIAAGGCTLVLVLSLVIGTGGRHGPAADFLFLMPVIATVAYGVTQARWLTLLAAAATVWVWFQPHTDPSQLSADTHLAFGLLGLAGFLVILEMAEVDRRTVVELMEQARRSLRQQRARIDDAATKLDRAQHIATLGRLAPSLGHELNNPLAAAIGELELALEALDRGQDPTADLLAAQRSVDQVREAVTDLRGFARTEPQGAFRCDPSAALDRALWLVGNDLHHRAQLVDGRDADLPLVGLEERQLERILVQLLTNAGRAIGDGQAALNVVTVRAIRELDGCRITVEDTGRGLPPGDAERLFQPLVSSSASGTGLGLYMCRTLANRAGGTLELAPRHAGQGAIATLWLPAVSD